ncbi:hypothetical protein X975_20805, partial [Stegodyphus mimosarum]
MRNQVNCFPPVFKLYLSTKNASECRGKMPKKKYHLHLLQN